MPDVFAIDPGPERSAYVWLDNSMQYSVHTSGIVANERLLDLLAIPSTTIASCVGAIEMVASYGMPVGEDVFDTCVWIGRFIQAAKFPMHYVYRKDVKMHLCGNMRAKDSNIRQVLIDKFGPGKDKAIGTKKAPGPLYGVKKDMWAALAVAVTWVETQKENANE